MHQEVDRGSAITIITSLPINGFWLSGVRNGDAEARSAVATTADLDAMMNCPSVPPITGASILAGLTKSGRNFQLFRGSSQTAQRSEVGVGRLPPPGRHPYFCFQFDRSRRSYLPLETALATFTLITRAFGPARKRPRLSNAKGKMSGGGRCAIHKLGDTI